MTEQKLFSENNKISGRQIFRLLSYDLLGIGTLLIPAMLAETAGRDGIFCILAGMVFALFYLKLLELLFRRGKKQGEDYLAECKKSVGSILYLFYFLYFVLMAAYAAYLFAVLVNHYLVEHINFLLILGLILLLSFYSMTAGIEGRARVYEILFWILMIPFFLMLLAACREVDTAYWSPIAQTGWKGLVKGSAYTFFGFSAIAIVPFLKSYAKMNGNGTKKDVVFWNAKRQLFFPVG